MLPISLLLICFLPLALFAQFTPPYDPRGNGRNWSIKGKALPWVLVDVNTGVFLKRKDISTTYLHNHTLITDTSRPFGPGLRFAANLVYWFYIRKPKTP